MKLWFSKADERQALRELQDDILRGWQANRLLGELAWEEHKARCKRAYVQRCIEQAAPLGRIGQ